MIKYNATQPPYWKSSHKCSATPQCYSCALSLQNLTHCHIALLLIDITVPPIYTTIKKKNKHHSTDKLCQEGCSLLKLLMFTVLAMQILALNVFPNHSWPKNTSFRNITGGEWEDMKQDQIKVIPGLENISKMTKLSKTYKIANYHPFNLQSQ